MMPASSTPAPPTFSVVIPALNASGTLGSCLEAVLGGGLEPGDEVVVVDDGSVDATAALAGGHGCGLVRSGEPGSPRGAAAARNLGARRARGGSHLVFLDADVVPPPGWRPALAGVLGRSPIPDAVVAFPSDVPSLPGFVSAYKQLFIHQTYRRMAPGPLNGLYSAFLCMARPLFEELGGFDERFRGASFEDLDLGLRARAAGAAIHLTDRLCWGHLHPYSLGGCLKNDFARARGYVRTVLGDPALRRVLARRGSANNAGPRLALSTLGAAGIAAGGLGAAALLALPHPPAALAALQATAAALLLEHLLLNHDFMHLLFAVGGGSMALKGLLFGPLDHAAMGLGMGVGALDVLRAAIRGE